MVGVGDDLGEVGQELRGPAVDLDADLDAEALGVLSDLVQAPADLPQGGVEVGPPGDAVGPDLHAGSAQVVREADVFLRPLDVLADDRRVGRLILEGAAEAGELDRRVGEPLFYLLAPRAGQIDLDLVRVSGPQLNPLIVQGLEPLEDRGKVPVLGDIVGDGSQLDHRSSPLERG